MTSEGKSSTMTDLIRQDFTLFLEQVDEVEALCETLKEAGASLQRAAQELREGLDPDELISRETTKGRN